MTTTLNERKHATAEDIARLLNTDGELSFHINVVKGYHVPFVFFQRPGEEQEGYGPILHQNQLIAGTDLLGLVEALRESYGEQVKIYAHQNPYRQPTIN